MILEDEEAIEIGAEARNMEIDEYEMYLNLKIQDNIEKSIAETLGIEESEVESNKQLILDNQEALEIGSNLIGLSVEEYKLHITQQIAQNQMITEKFGDIQDKLAVALEEGAMVLDMESSELAQDLSILKTEVDAFNVVAESAGVTDEILTTLINKQIASEAIAIDNGIDFEIKDYLLLNLGLFLLMFATSGVSFLFSCIFNLSKNYMAFGAGIPLAFFLFDMMANVSSSLEAAKYLSLNTLFNTDNILNGDGYVIQFAILFIIGIVLYGASIKVFNEKDLPL